MGRRAHWVVRWSSSTSGISWRHYVQGSDYVPVPAVRIVAGLSDGISRRQAFDSPPFGNNVLIASHDKDFGVSHHCKYVHAAVTGRANTCEKCCRFRAFLPNRKSLIAEIKKPNSNALVVSIPEP